MRQEYNSNQGKQGAIEHTSTSKTQITIHLDDDVLDWLRSQENTANGSNSQTLINNALREHMLPHYSYLSDEQEKKAIFKDIADFFVSEKQHHSQQKNPSYRSIQTLGKHAFSWDFYF